MPDLTKTLNEYLSHQPSEWADDVQAQNDENGVITAILSNDWEENKVWNSWWTLQDWSVVFSNWKKMSPNEYFLYLLHLMI